MVQVFSESGDTVSCASLIPKSLHDLACRNPCMLHLSVILETTIFHPSPPAASSSKNILYLPPLFH